MWQNNLKHVKSAKFYRHESVVAIDVITHDNLRTSLYENSIKYFAKYLSDIEIEEAIVILLADKKAMLKPRNFPPVFDEMLSDLINVQEERYSAKKDKKVKLGYSVSIGKLEEIRGLYYKIKNVHAYSIDVGSDRANAERIDLESDYRYLVLSFREGKEEDE